MSDLAVISEKDIVLDLPYKKWVLLNFKAVQLEDHMKDGDQFEGNILVEFPDGEAASYKTIFEVTPDSTSILMEQIPRSLAGAVQCDRSGNDFIGAKYQIEISDHVDGIRLMDLD